MLATASPIERSGPLKIMVVDDSFVIRALLARVFENDPTVTVTTTASNGKIAVSELEKKEIDVIVLDIEMPVMDGLTAIPLLLQADPYVQIIVASTLTHKNAEISLRALRAGASDYMPKPTTSGDLNGADQFKADLLNKVKELGQVSRRKRREKADIANSASVVKPVQKRELVLHPSKHYPKPSIISIGSSTGGPQALFTLLGLLKGKIHQPIVITQHMPATFTSILANHIMQQTGTPCEEASEGMIVEPGKIMIAAGDYHLTFVKDGTKVKAHLNHGEPVNFCRPAVDVMLRSLMEIYDNRILSVILTGLGADGKNSCSELFNRGGAVLAQDEATSVVWGMPGSVAMAGICADVQPLSHLATTIERMAR